MPEILRDKRIVVLDLALMVAGTKYRGQFEERIKAVMTEVRRVKDVVLFIDELHTLVGAGGAEGAIDASNVLKPALSRGEIQCIGATTLDEYRKHIEKDGALERRFQSVTVDPPTPEQAVEILKGLRERYEEHHRVAYTDEALELAVELSSRYINNRFLPDKAIDVMDEAGARVRIKAMVPPPDVKELSEQIDDLEKQKDQAVSDQDFELAARMRDEAYQLKKKREEVQAEWRKEQAEIEQVGEVDVEVIQETISKMTGIPLTRLEKAERERLLQMEKELGAVVIHQEDAIAAIARAVRRSRSGLKDPRRPMGSFLFLGPSGVGKTFLCKQLAKFMFGDEDAIITMDMSEYMEKHNASRLVGAPPGYVGYEEGGQLTEKVRRRPYSVVLLDEIEKAHPDVFNMLLQIMEEGRLTDSFGRHVDFRNVILIMTSNLGSHTMTSGGQLGFERLEANELAEEERRNRNKTNVMVEVERHFPPRVLEPSRRGHRLQPPHPRGPGDHRAPATQRGPRPHARARLDPRGHPRCHGPLDRQGLQRRLRRPPLAPRHRAPDRGPHGRTPLARRTGRGHHPLRRPQRVRRTPSTSPPSPPLSASPPRRSPAPSNRPRKLGSGQTPLPQSPPASPRGRVFA